MKKYTIAEGYHFYDGYMTLTATKNAEEDNEDLYWLFVVDPTSDEREYHVTKLPRFIQDMKDYSVLETVSEKDIDFAPEEEL